MRIQLEGLEQNSPDGGCKSIDVDNGSLITDHHFALRRCLETAESLFSGSPPGSPTFFVQPGRILPQLDSSKSSEHVPDTAVFAGDLDQLRTIAEQEQPESELKGRCYPRSSSYCQKILNSKTKVGTRRS